MSINTEVDIKYITPKNDYQAFSLSNICFGCIKEMSPIGAVCSGSTLFASILNLSVMLGNYLQRMPSADDIFRCIFFLAL